jgi:DNA relaxase NicK
MSKARGESAGGGAEKLASEGAHSSLESDALPPSTNRGVTMTVDYLSITVHTNLKHLAEIVLDELLGYERSEDSKWDDYFFNLNRHARGYRAVYQAPEQILIQAYPYDGKHCHLVMKGQSLSAFSVEALGRFVRALIESDLRWRTTRLDVAFDHCPFTPLMCKEAYREGRFRTKARRTSGKWYESEDGNTFYLGSRSSSRYLRVYDMRGFTRCELETKNDYSESLGEALVDPQTFKETALGYLRSYLEFTEESVQGKNSSRVKLAHWWEELVGSAEKHSIEQKPEIEQFLLQKTLRHFERMLPTLCVFREGLCIDLNEAVEARLPYLEEKHLAKIKQLKKV